MYVADPEVEIECECTWEGEGEGDSIVHCSAGLQSRQRYVLFL